MAEKNLNICVGSTEKADVVVVGGGPSGCAAAVAAAREGKSVVLLERSGMLGGSATLSGVAIFMIVGNYTGFYREVVREIRPDFESSVSDPAAFKVHFTPERLRLALNSMLLDAGVDVRLHCDYITVCRDHDLASERTVVFNTVEGVSAIEARVVVDATGNGRVACDAGASLVDQGDGCQLQPMSMIFQMQDTGHEVPSVLPKGCPRYECVEELPQARVLKWEKQPEGTLLVNMTRVMGDGSKAKDLNRAEREGLEQVFSVAHYLQGHGFENYILSSIGSQVGVRESRQVEGLHVLCEDDLVVGRKFDDVVAQSNYNIDIHGQTGADGTEERDIERYDIPYRCMVPKNVEGVLVTGRAISATHVAISSARVMPTCFALGQAAGIAAAIAIEEGKSLSQIDAAELRRRLENQDVAFDE